MWVPRMRARKFASLRWRNLSSSSSSVTKACTMRKDPRASWAPAAKEARHDWISCPTPRSRLDDRSMNHAARGRMVQVTKVRRQLI